MKKIIFILILFGNVLYSQYLRVPQVFQEQDQWCWAGSSACVLKYYGKNISQCTIAEYTRTVSTWHNFGSVNCCTDPSQGCNYWNYNWGTSGSIQDILQHWGVQNSGVSNALSTTQIQTELNSQRPFIFRWGWTTGGGHFLIGHGYISSTSQMYYMDPWFNEGLHIATYSWIVSNADHSWTHTNVISTNPSIPSVPVLLYPAQGSTNVSQPIVFKWGKCDRSTSYRIMIALDTNFTNVAVSDSSLTDTLKTVSGFTSNTKYFWKVKAKSGSTSSDYSTISSFRTKTTGIKLISSEVPDEFKLASSYPNPFNENTVIKIKIKEASYISMKIFDVMGKEQMTIFNGNCNPGIYEIKTSFAKLSSGLYFCVMQAIDLKNNKTLYFNNLKLAYTK
ncbi:MAG: C39 family peptidase [Ignavibacteria bacterium]|jgi:hypothetical protein